MVFNIILLFIIERGKKTYGYAYSYINIQLYVNHNDNGYLIFR